MQEKNKSSIEMVLLTNVIIFGMYIITFARNNSVFFVFFLIERVMAVQYENEVSNYIMNSSPEDVTRRSVVITLGLTLVQVALFIYAFFKHPSLFIFVMVGEFIDFMNIRFKQKIKDRKNNK